MKGKNIIEKLFSAALPKAKQNPNAVVRYSPLLQSRLREGRSSAATSERFAHRSVTACIH